MSRSRLIDPISDESILDDNSVLTPVPSPCPVPARSTTFSMDLNPPLCSSVSTNEQCDREDRGDSSVLSVCRYCSVQCRGPGCQQLKCIKTLWTLWVCSWRAIEEQMNDMTQRERRITPLHTSAPRALNSGKKERKKKSEVSEKEE